MWNIDLAAVVGLSTASHNVPRQTEDELHGEISVGPFGPRWLECGD